MQNDSPIPLNLPRWLRPMPAVAMTAALLLSAGSASAQNRRQGNAGLGGLLAAGELRQALGDMDLSTDEKSKTDELLEKAQSDMRQALQGLRDATPEERQDKLKDLAKQLEQTKTQAYADLTPAHQTELAKKLATRSVERAVKAVAAEKKKLADVDVPADQKKQADALFDEASKTLDGYKTDADAVKDSAGETTLSQKVAQTFQSTNHQLATLIGEGEAREVVQAGRMSARPGAPAGGGARQRRATTNPA